MDNLFVARQPIYDNKLRVMGYELLYRSGDVDKAIFEDGDLASCETILNAFMHIGIDNLAGSSLAFINLPKEFVINESLTPMFKEQSVLEILEDVVPTPDVIEGIKRLKSEGYKIALDDFKYQDNLVPLIELADFIKIDVIENNEEEIKQELKYLEKFDAEVIAEKVETQELHTLCKDLGFQYFQGFFFCKPQLVKQKHIPANKAVVLNLMNKVQSPEMDFDDFENILAQDVTLSYKLLRYINSAMFALRREVDSIKDAVVLLGQNNVKKWLSLILMSKISDEKPNELIVTAMTRGKMCELLAEKINPEIQPQMFIIGLFSVLDALMDTPMIDLLDTVILSVPIKLALMDQAGEQGEILKMVLNYEQLSWDELINSSASTKDLVESYIEAVNWADQSIKALAN